MFEVKLFGYFADKSALYINGSNLLQAKFLEALHNSTLLLLILTPLSDQRSKDKLPQKAHYIWTVVEH